VIVAVCDAGHVHCSTDNATTWSIWSQACGTSPRVGVSGDASTIALTNSGNGLIVTHDGGSTFTPSWGLMGSGKVTEFALSKDGSRIVAVTGDMDGGLYPGYIYVSADGGKSWESKTEPGMKLWTSCTCSDDGMVIAACATAGGGSYIYRSKDGGETWSIESGAGLHTWSFIKGSADGLFYIALAADSTKYYVGK
jgi:photosystem II stability/assembly factor-like uncharacterized protein